MFNRNVSPPRVVMLLAFLALAAVFGPAFAQSAHGPNSGQSAVYLDVRPIGHARDSSLPEAAIESMARDKLRSLGHSVMRVHGQALPADAAVLRILYTVHRQAGDGAIALAASASVQVLRTRDQDHDGVIQTLSVYNSLQQVLVQGRTEAKATARLRDAFDRQLRARISAGMLQLLG